MRGTYPLRDTGDVSHLAPSTELNVSPSPQPAGSAAAPCAAAIARSTEMQSRTLGLFSLHAKVDAKIDAMLRGLARQASRDTGMSSVCVCVLRMCTVAVMVILLTVNQTTTSQKKM